MAIRSAQNSKARQDLVHKLEDMMGCVVVIGLYSIHRADVLGVSWHHFFFVEQPCRQRLLKGDVGCLVVLLFA